MSPIENASKPVMPTPSVAQQRITVVIFFVLIGLAMGWQHRGDGASYVVQKFSQTPVPDAVEQLDFTTAEAAWSGLRIDSHGNLQIDSQTETALSEAVVLMDSETSGLPLARMAFLLEKQFGATARQQVMELLPLLKRYREAQQHWWEENASREPPHYAELFALQDELFGEQLAAQMFSGQRRLASMMLASQQIRNDANLTDTEKEQALMDLQKTLHEPGAPGE
jgi:hypothetical protein